MRRIVLQTLLAASIGTIGQARVIYVDNATHGPRDGLSWETAYRDLQDALADARSKYLKWWQDNRDRYEAAIGVDKESQR